MNAPEFKDAIITTRDANDDSSNQSTKSYATAPAPTAVATASVAPTTQVSASNTTHIANNSARIDANEKAIAQNSQDIKDLRKAFEHQAEVMDGAMAQGIATSSLVMPYNVGKISTTVALGHSGSADAIAGGLGMRFTENFTARANVAYDTGSENVSVGAGVGYEW
ncbi:adherence and invasion outermembrane protein [Vibrio sp. JCM 19236]|nr:adherence and invasion outermembrane protein [Vibrio sp. JCM 19236]